MTVIKRFLRNFARIKSSTANENDPGLAFSIEWSKHLITVLKKHRNDKEFTKDVIDSAIIYYKDNLTEQDRLDVFAYLLGSIVNNK
jgi:hypothetical protein